MTSSDLPYGLTPEMLERSRAKLGVPEEWEWYPCSNECGDVVWCPPGTGDIAVEVVCSSECAMAFMDKKYGIQP